MSEPFQSSLTIIWAEEKAELLGRIKRLEEEVKRLQDDRKLGWRIIREMADAFEKIDPVDMGHTDLIDVRPWKLIEEAREAAKGFTT